MCSITFFFFFPFFFFPLTGFARIGVNNFGFTFDLCVCAPEVFLSTFLLFFVLLILTPDRFNGDRALRKMPPLDSIFSRESIWLTCKCKSCSITLEPPSGTLSLLSPLTCAITFVNPINIFSFGSETGFAKDIIITYLYHKDKRILFYLFSPC